MHPSAGEERRGSEDYRHRKQADTVYGNQDAGQERNFESGAESVLTFRRWDKEASLAFPRREQSGKAE